MNKRFMNRGIFSLIFVAAPLVAGAASGTGLNLSPLDYLVLGILAFIVLVLAFLMYALGTLIHQIRGAAGRKPLFAGFLKSMTDSVPLEKEATILTDHVYDDIRELDNNLPPWWKYMFYATIVFSGIYLYIYHYSGSGKLQDEEYREEIANAEKQKEEYMKLAANGIDENSVKLLHDPKVIESGKVLFMQNCAACHGRAGEGGVGPNLTDEYWLHGGGVKNVFKTIKYGVPEKGMISWKTQLSPSNIQDVTNYIMSLQGTNPPNSKAPQGDKYTDKKELASKDK